MKKYHDKNGIELTQKDYLYGIDAEIAPIPAEFICRRIEALKEHLAELLDVPHLQRCGSRCNAIIKSIEFWEKINDK